MYSVGSGMVLALGDPPGATVAARRHGGRRDPFGRRHGRLWRGSFPTSQPHSRPSAAAGENAPRQDIPLDWVRGVERLHRLPAHAGVPQHRWGVFLNDVDQFGRGGWAQRAADLGWGTLMSSNAPAGPPERRRSAVAHLRRQNHRHAERLGDDRERRRAAHRP
jgi:hypothetical protein